MGRESVPRSLGVRLFVQVVRSVNIHCAGPPQGLLVSPRVFSQRVGMGCGAALLATLLCLFVFSNLMGILNSVAPVVATWVVEGVDSGLQ